jgi:hypothetical protein
MLVKVAQRYASKEIVNSFFLKFRSVQNMRGITRVCAWIWVCVCMFVCVCVQVKMRWTSREYFFEEKNGSWSSWKEDRGRGLNVVRLVEGGVS